MCVFCVCVYKRWIPHSSARAQVTEAATRSLTREPWIMYLPPPRRCAQTHSFSSYERTDTLTGVCAGGASLLPPSSVKHTQCIARPQRGIKVRRGLCIHNKRNEAVWIVTAPQCVTKTHSVRFMPAEKQRCTATGCFQLLRTFNSLLFLGEYNGCRFAEQRALSYPFRWL